MAIGIHKSGQGYWVRVLTATLIGLVAIAFASWAYQQASVLVAQLPKSAFNMSLAKLELNKAVAPGTMVTLCEKDPANTDLYIEIGTGRLETEIKVGGPVTPQVRIDNISVKDGKDAQQTILIRDTAGGRIADVTNRSGIPPVEPALVQGGFAAVVILIGAIFAFWFCAARPSSVDFLVSTDFEMKRVNWSTRREIVGSTWVVIGACFLLSASLFAYDLIFQAFFRSIHVLEIGTKAGQ